MRKTAAPSVRSRFATLLSAFVTSECGNDQGLAGTALGISQSHVSALVLDNRGPGVNVAIALAKATGRTLDDVLLGDAHRGVRPAVPAGWRKFGRPAQRCGA